MHIWGKYARKTPKMIVNMQFQAKTAKYENRNIFDIIIRIETKFEAQGETNDIISCVV